MHGPTPIPLLRPLAKLFEVARVSAKEHMANYQAARALLGKGNSAVTRVKERLATASLSTGGPGFQRVRERGSSAKKGAKSLVT